MYNRKFSTPSESSAVCECFDPKGNSKLGFNIGVEFVNPGDELLGEV